MIKKILVILASCQMLIFTEKQGITVYFRLSGKVNASAVKLNITKSEGVPIVKNFAVYMY
jgi:hypothetical protein